MKAIRIFLLVVIVIGLGLIATYTLWVPKLVTAILQSEGVNTEFMTPSSGSATTSQSVPLEQNQATIGIGNTAYANGIKITLNKVSQDSRCPEGVMCIQAGSVLANITMQSGTDMETVDLDSNKIISFNSFAISIITVKPVRGKGGPPDANSYFLTFQVASR